MPRSVSVWHATPDTKSDTDALCGVIQRGPTPYVSHGYTVIGKKMFAQVAHYALDASSAPQVHFEKHYSCGAHVDRVLHATYCVGHAERHPQFNSVELVSVT